MVGGGAWWGRAVDGGDRRWALDFGATNGKFDISNFFEFLKLITHVKSRVINNVNSLLSIKEDTVTTL